MSSGNLGADGAAAWALPMNEDGGRSSIIRRHVPVSIGPAEPEDGMMMDSWALASDTSFAQVTHIRASSYYGAMPTMSAHPVSVQVVRCPSNFHTSVLRRQTRIPVKW